MKYIKFNEDQNICHFGRCSIISNAEIKQIIVEPLNKDLKIFFCSFNQQIFQQKNIISVLANNQKSIDLILIFKREQTCVTVFKHICKNKSPLTGQLLDAKAFYEQLLFPLMKNILANEILNEKLKKTANKILQFSSINNVPLNEIINIDESHSNGAITANKNIQLKRKRNHQKNATVFTQNFTVKKFTKNGSSKNRLIVFINSEKTLCYEYHWLKSNNYYVCSGCDTHKQRRTVTARIVEKWNKEKFVKLSETSHICQPRKYDPDKFNSDLIVAKPGYKKVEYFENGVKKKKIIVFTDDKKRCYEFSENATAKAFNCIKCKNKKLLILAKICINANGEEHLSICNKRHLCEPIEYQPDAKAPKIVKKPYFDFVKRRVNGMIVEKLVIFDEKDPSMCYEYKKHKNDYFNCYNCYKKEKKYCVSAKLFKDEKNGDYLELNQKAHICGLQKFIPEELDSNIIYSDGFTTDEYRAYDGIVKPRLIVFDRQDRSLCHIYHNIRNRGRDYWICWGCLKLKSSKSLKFNQTDPQKPYIELSVKPHICQLQPYIPIKIEPYNPPKIIKKPNYIIENYVMKNGKMGKRLIIFVSNDRQLCYIYAFTTKYGYFFCKPCGGTTAYVIAKVCKDEKNGEYIKLNDREHTCQPQPYSPDDQEDSIQIIKKPDFIFRSDEKNKILIVFDPSNKELCYKYTYWPASKRYVCKKCRNFNKKTSAKLIKDENGEDCIQLYSIQHLCELEPVDPKTEEQLSEYEKKKRIAAAGMLRRHHHRDLNYTKLNDNFEDENATQLQILHDQNYKIKIYHENGIKKTRLWVFPENNRKKCYEYFWSNNYECFLCCGCEAKKPKNYATAIILNATRSLPECLELGQNLHKCEIRNFDLKIVEEKYQNRKIIKKPGFKVVKSKNVVEQLVIFHESNQSFCYVYTLKKGSKSTYFCGKCKKNDVTAKIILNEKEGDYVELGIKEHECKPQKCLPNYL